MHSIVLLACSLTTAHGCLYGYTHYYDESPAYSYSRTWLDAPADSMTRSAWLMSPEHYSVQIQTPAVEDGSVKVSLSPDGTMLNVNAKRRIEGCHCQESTVGQVRLPHTPRSDDVDVTHDPKTGVVSVKLARHAKVDEPIPLTVKTLEPEPKPEARPLRFVPHKSAAPSSAKDEEAVGADEKRLLEKFRAVASVARVGSHQPAGATPAEGEHERAVA